MRHGFLGRALWASGTVLAAGLLAALLLVEVPIGRTQAEGLPQTPPPAVAVSVATVEPRLAVLWDEFSGRLEAVERVDVRSRVAGALKAVHFREGALVKQGDLLITIDPDPYAAEVERADAQLVAAEARVTLARSELERGHQLLDSRTVSPRDFDQRNNAFREAEANVRAAKAALQATKLNLDYTQIRAPVSGRIGRLEVTVGNLVAAGPTAPVLTTLVSVDPIYASFNADEAVVARALASVDRDPASAPKIEQIAVQVTIGAQDGPPLSGSLQLIDNQVDARSGTVRVRAVFANPHGHLMAGQFARIRMASSKPAPVIAITERAIGTDQSKKFVMVVDAANTALYREVMLGGAIDGLRIVTSGLARGERIVVSGLQRIRPGSPVAPEPVTMEGRTVSEAQPAAGSTTVR